MLYPVPEKGFDGLLKLKVDGKKVIIDYNGEGYTFQSGVADDCLPIISQVRCNPTLFGMVLKHKKSPTVCMLGFFSNDMLYSPSES